MCPQDTWPHALRCLLPRQLSCAATGRRDGAHSVGQMADAAVACKDSSSPPQTAQCCIMCQLGRSSTTPARHTDSANCWRRHGFPPPPQTSWAAIGAQPAASPHERLGHHSSPGQQPGRPGCSWCRGLPCRPARCRPQATARHRTACTAIEPDQGLGWQHKGLHPVVDRQKKRGHARPTGLSQGSIGSSK